MTELLDKIGTIQAANVTEVNDKAVFSQISGQTLATNRSEFETVPSVGTSITGFIYEDKKHQLRLTTILPKARLDHYAYGTVTEVRRDLGVFVDVGLPDKDLVVSIDDLPENKQIWPAVGDRLMITLSVDKKGRMWGKLADETIFEAISNRASQADRNKDVSGTTYRLRAVGSLLLTDDYYLGFIHNTERDVEPRLGEHVSGRVIGLTADGMLNISLRPRAYEEIGDDAGMILAVLKRNPNHAIDFNDKSDPAAIKEFFGISKGAFKRALGHLLKAGLIEETDNQTKLK
ncbi:RNA-binding protein [Agrilactobacillus composti DSM 18527 = JCM 14202]|uniref:RNA-binding protein n=1 Tax=Agrilactobacillus composti DSM 18527 = JCM 14202 TaxID=1423734 RepID=X0PDF4_9LACO|nr:S1-like domain-containing RNA-binding protein [Agrilactobacillus composti]KRM36567.1 RNA-binding protein [Agrilactobacillus composti DSM 18527 = JCM 14202]GAF39114.1 S1 RNA binding domain [Agrilactobacillus composti DSM 18527 = JCM 14202]